MSRYVLSAMVAMTTTCGFSHAQVFNPIGVPEGFASSYATAVSGDGTTVVGRVQSPFVTQAFRARHAEQIELLPTADGFFWSGAAAVSFDGSNIAGYHSMSFDYTAFRAVVWNGDAVGQGIPGTQSGESSAAGISADGRVVVGRYAAGFGTAFRYSEASGFVSADVSLSLGSGVSPDGNIAIGNYGVGSFIWREGSDLQPTGLHRAAAVTDLGLVAGSTFVNDSLHAALWSPGGSTTPLGVLAGDTMSSAAAISADGSIVVGQSGNRAFLWTEGTGLTDLHQYLTGLGVDLTGWGLTEATGISADGMTIVGNGTHEYAPGQFRTEGWSVTIPAPASALLLVLPLAQRRRRSTR